ncbi:MAG TPA: hypothetical protein DC000_00145 [Clostridiales bacterium]|nr:hypothetical protein [Clostridiales bacterium]
MYQLYSIKDFLIDSVKKINEISIISTIVDVEIETIRQKIVSLVDDQLIDTATEKGIARKEKMLKLQPFNDDTLETRRFRVKSNWNNQLPYSYRQLENVLDNMVGSNGYILTIDLEAFTLTLKINLGQKRMLQDASIKVDNIAPCNLALTVELQYNRHMDLAQFTHAQLATKTHVQLREEVL